MTSESLSLLFVWKKIHDLVLHHCIIPDNVIILLQAAQSHWFRLMIDLIDSQLFTAVVCTVECCLGVAEGSGGISWHLSTAALFCWICVATPAVEITRRGKKICSHPTGSSPV